MFFRLTMPSAKSNSKTGPIPVSTTSSDSCSSKCALFASCYAKGGPLAIVWKQTDAGKFSTGLDDFVAKIAAIPAGSLWRHNQAGDLPGEGDKIDAPALAKLVKANTGRKGFTYTHKPLVAKRTASASVKAIALANRRAVRGANRQGFTINASANNLRHADQLARLAIAPVVVVLPATVDGRVTKSVTTPAGRVVSVCPATYRDDVTCSSCGLCQRQGARSIVGFPAHGAAKRAASAIASN